MAMKKDFGNTVKEKTQTKKTVDKLTVLKESDAKTIYNLIFAKKQEEKGGQHP